MPKMRKEKAVMEMKLTKYVKKKNKTGKREKKRKNKFFQALSTIKAKPDSP